MHRQGWVAATDGNVSVRLDRDRLLCTPTCMSKRLVTEADLVICDFSGRKICGKRNQTSEIGMHTAAYRLRPDVQAVVHAHPVTATGFAAAGRPLDDSLLPEVIIHLGHVPIARYGLPGTSELTDELIPLIPYHNALLLQNHGCTTLGTDLQEAFFRMEVLEHFARITIAADLAGGGRSLPRMEVERLIAVRERYGFRTPA